VQEACSISLTRTMMVSSHALSSTRLLWEVELLEFLMELLPMAAPEHILLWVPGLPLAAV